MIRRVCRSGFSRDYLIASAVVAMFAATNAGAQEPAASERGKQVFDHWCAPCHGDGPGKPGTAALNALYKGQKPALLEERTDLVPELTKQFVRTGVSVMPFFRKTEISDSDLEALAAYLAP
ncbi:MAG TPA: cytochrome c [Gammaproteobacteria bacterium]|jgi:mono/diheme cytochrome c family protein